MRIGDKADFHRRMTHSARLTNKVRARLIKSIEASGAWSEKRPCPSEISPGKRPNNGNRGLSHKPSPIKTRAPPVVTNNLPRLSTFAQNS